MNSLIGAFYFELSSDMLATIVDVSAKKRWIATRQGINPTYCLNDISDIQIDSILALF